MRQLYIVPIIHSSTDLGKLEAVVSDVKKELISSDVLEASRQSVELFWRELKNAIVSWKFDYASTYLYQDALPVTGDAQDATLQNIVRELANKGSENHRVLQWLMDNGATPVGTEDPELLLREYQLAKETLRLFTDGGDAAPGALRDNLAAQQRLLAERDAFIVNRIDATLPSDKTGILFLGMLHRLDLDHVRDLTVRYPFGRPARNDVRFARLG